MSSTLNWTYRGNKKKLKVESTKKTSREHSKKRIKTTSFVASSSKEDSLPTRTMAVYHLLLSSPPSLLLLPPSPRRPNLTLIRRIPAYPRLGHSTSLLSSSSPVIRKILVRSTLREDQPVASDAEIPTLLIGEDSAAFELGKQKLVSWVYFGVVLGVVLFILNVVWIDNSTGFGKSYIDAVSNISGSSEVCKH